MTRPPYQHPAILMVKVWAACIILYAALPIHLVDRTLTVEGYLMFALFLFAFCLGTVIPSPARAHRVGSATVDFTATEAALATVATVAAIAMLLDLRDKSIFDLADAYDMRSDQASALMEGSASASSIWFQIGFLTYPAAYVYLVRAVIYERRPSLLRIGAFGVVPVLLATASMGGRGPLLYAILLTGFAWRVRKGLLGGHRAVRPKRSASSRWIWLAVIGVVAAALYYFMAVFIARAEVVGGAEGMFRFAESVWGIGFHGPVADLMFAVLGTEVTYLLFIFGWYVVQGFVMFCILASDYHGPMQFGVYGLDLMSALVRRFDGSILARNFDSLQQVGVYGFFPSAFGSLYVDLWMFGLIACTAWGTLAGLVHQKVRAGRDPRWLLLAPFVTMGILFSFINTPLGFSNGLTTYIWLLVAFAMAKRGHPAVTIVAPSPA